MIHKNKTRSSTLGIVKSLIALGILLSTFYCPKAQAATDDVAFKECLQAFGQTPDALTTDTWRTSALDPKVAQLENPNLYGSVVVRWISHKNENGTTTIVVLTRDPDPQPEDDPDSFDVILEQQGHLSVKVGVGANGFSFAKQAQQGVNGLLFCTQGDLSKLWTWQGDNWGVSK